MGADAQEIPRDTGLIRPSRSDAKRGTRHTSEDGGYRTVTVAMLWKLPRKADKPRRMVMRLVEPTPRGYKIISQFRIPKRGRQPFFAYPVVCGGRLYVRHEDRLYAYDVAPLGSAVSLPAAPQPKPGRHTGS